MVPRLVMLQQVSHHRCLFGWGRVFASHIHHEVLVALELTAGANET